MVFLRFPEQRISGIMRLRLNPESPVTYTNVVVEDGGSGYLPHGVGGDTVEIFATFKTGNAAVTPDGKCPHLYSPQKG